MKLDQQKLVFNCRFLREGTNTRIIMPEKPTSDNAPQTADEKVKSAEEISLEEAETALNAKDYKSAREILDKLGEHRAAQE